jgi:molybdopterin adenylyltransferase
MHKAGVLIVSVKGTERELTDACNDLITRALHSIKVTVARFEDVAARESVITNTLAMWADSGEVDFIITSGATGLGPEDVMPEATRSVVDKEIPGIAELMRLDGYKKTHTAILSRAVAGIRGKCLIINLPGNPEAVEEYLNLILPVIPHAVDALRPRTVDSI